MGPSKSVTTPRRMAQKESGHEDKYCRVYGDLFRMESKDLLLSVGENQSNSFPKEAVFLFVSLLLLFFKNRVPVALNG